MSIPEPTLTRQAHADALDEFRKVLDAAPPELALDLMWAAQIAARRRILPEVVITETQVEPERCCDTCTCAPEVERTATCPWQGCVGTSFYEVDASERWNELDFNLDDGPDPDGKYVATVHQGDGDYESVCYICQDCTRPVAVSAFDVEW